MKITMKECLTTILLPAAIWFAAFGIHIDNPIFMGIGGFLIGVYNSMLQKRLNEK